MAPITQAHINLTAMQANLATVKQLAPHSQIMAVIKANAYGHGLIPIAQTLTTADGFAVVELEEALALRASGITQRILLLGGTVLDENAVVQCANQSIDVLTHSLSMLAIICQTKVNKPLAIWLKLDTGMHRLGLHYDEWDQALKQAKQCPHIGTITLMTHLSHADDLTRSTTQHAITQFMQANDKQALPMSMANSAAIIHYRNSHADWIRPGLMLYGVNPCSPGSRTLNRGLSLQPAMTLTAPILAIRTIQAGEGVGYNHRWISRKKTKIATVGIGYSHGYPHTASNGTPVLIHGQRAPLVGAVSMDMITIDISQCSAVQVGDTVTLWGEKLPVEEIAQHAQTISYALLTAIADKVPRIYEPVA